MKNRVYIGGIFIIALLFIIPTIVKYFVLTKAEGVVIRLNEGTFMGLGGWRRTTFQFPTVQFTCKDSVCYYDKGNEVLLSIPQLGDKVTVLYNAKDIIESYLDRFGSYWFPLPRILIFILLCIAWIGVCGVIFASGTRS